MPLYAWHLGDMRPVLDLIERFGDEIEYDLHAQLGMDLLDFFRGRYTWDKLLRLVAQLPWWSRFQLAHADDDEIAAGQHEQAPENTGKAQRPPLSTWDPFKELRADMMDGFNALIAQQSGDKKRRKPKPAPRPEAAQDRVRRAADHATVTELFDTFTPGR